MPVNPLNAGSKVYSFLGPFTHCSQYLKAEIHVEINGRNTSKKKKKEVKILTE